MMTTLQPVTQWNMTSGIPEFQSPAQVWPLQSSSAAAPAPTSCSCGSASAPGEASFMQLAIQIVASLVSAVQTLCQGLLAMIGLQKSPPSAVPDQSVTAANTQGPQSDYTTAGLKETLQSVLGEIFDPANLLDSLFSGIGQRLGGLFKKGTSLLSRIF